MESEITYEYKDFLENGMKFTAYRESSLGESLVHKHDFLELCYIISGNATHYVDGAPYQLTKGDLLVIDTDQTHYYRSEGGVLYANMILLPDFISENLHSSHTALDVFAYFLYNSEFRSGDGSVRPPLVSFRGNDLISADGIVNSMCDEILSKGSNYVEVVSSYLNILFYLIIRNIEKTNRDNVMHDIRNNRLYRGQLRQPDNPERRSRKILLFPVIFQPGFQEVFRHSLLVIRPERAHPEDNPAA